MQLVTVGTGTVAPSATRTAACNWVSHGRLKILLDCGAGALHRLAQFLNHSGHILAPQVRNDQPRTGEIGQCHCRI